MYCLFVLFYVLFVLFYVLFVCKCVLLPPGVNPIAVKYIISSYHIISYHNTLTNAYLDIGYQIKTKNRNI